jgi:hypothetical protein
MTSSVPSGADDGEPTEMSSAIDRRSVRVGLVSGLMLGAAASAGLAYSNLGPSSRSPSSDNGVAVLGGYGVVALVFLAYGFVGRARRMSVRECAVAGAITGLVALGIVAVTMAVINNVWLSTVARQPDKIYGLAHSHFHTMRAYLNAQLALGLVVLPPIVAAGSAVLTATGAHLARRSPPTNGVVRQPA